ncbi:MAG: NfeD family protein [Geobacter sp.]
MITIVWWHWLVLGLCLIGLELLIPSFTIVWFGLGALAVGLLVALLPFTPLWLQGLIWAVASVAFTLMWFKYLKPKNSMTHAGQSKEAIVGETGIVIRGTTDSYTKGKVRFRIAILGADEWTCYAEEPLDVGETVRVEDIEGQILKVRKL